MKKILSGIFIIVYIYPCLGQTITDIDGNVYNTVVIGAQTWMKENLRVTRFNDGTVIPVVTDNHKWANLDSAATCTYNNTDNPDTILTYGRLYNWFAVDSNRLCPFGWKVPSNIDFSELINFLGDWQKAGGLLKEEGTDHWLAPNDGADNSTGFTALPGGYRDPDHGTYKFIGYGGGWWSSSIFSDSTLGGFLGMEYYDSYACLLENGRKKYGNSVRCMMDNSVSEVKKIEVGSVSVYPNPTKNLLYIKSTKNINYSVEIVNLQGELIYKSNNVSNTINVNNLKSGIYLIRFLSPGNTQNLKVIKE